MGYAVDPGNHVSSMTFNDTNVTPRAGVYSTGFHEKPKTQVKHKAYSTGTTKQNSVIYTIKKSGKISLKTKEA